MLAEEGVDLRDAIIGHCGDTADVDYLMKLADQGSILGMDRFGMNVLLPLDDRVTTVVQLVKYPSSRIAMCCRRSFPLF